MTGLVRQPRGMSEVPVRVSEEPMKIRIISSALAVSAVTLIAGAAFSGGVKSSDSELVDFDQKSGRLWAVPQHGNVAEFEHRRGRAARRRDPRTAPGLRHERDKGFADAAALRLVDGVVP